MKKEDIFKELSNIDTEMIAEADPSAPIVRKKGRTRRKVVIIAACAAVLLISLLAAVPYLADEISFRISLPDELKKYANSDYIRLMYQFHNYNFDEISWRNYSGDSDEFMEDSSFEKGKYTEVTDNQIEGVIEGDLFKRSDKNIYYFDGNEDAVLVYSIEGEGSRLVAEYELGLDKMKVHELVQDPVLYLSEDCSNLTLIVNYYDKEKVYISNSYFHKVVVISFDVSQPDTIVKKNEVVVSGKNSTSRLIDGKIYLVNTYYPQQINYADEATYLPQIDSGVGFETISRKDIIMPKTLKTKQSTLVIKIDEDSLDVESVLEFFIPTSNYYFSEDTLYIASNYMENFEETYDGKECIVRKRMTDIAAVDISKKKLKHIGGITVDGATKDQYSFDEYEGILRVVTETNSETYIGGTWKRSVFWYATDEDSVYIYNGTNAALYCIDTESWKIVGEVRDFAPQGETVESVRFDGTKAYVCTAKVVIFSDPVYFFDLSDMSNITYTDTGEIEGFSSSLVDFGEGLSLGIGYGNSETTLKIEIYAEGDGIVESVCIYEKENVYFPTEYKSYYINRDRFLVGIPIIGTTLSDGTRAVESGYLLLRFNGETFEEVLKVKLENFYYYSENTRATIIEGYLYVFYNNQFYVHKTP